MIDNFYTLTWNCLSSPLIAAATEAANESDSDEGSLVLAGVLLSLVVIYFASQLGGEICSRINLPPVFRTITWRGSNWYFRIPFVSVSRRR